MEVDMSSRIEGGCLCRAVRFEVPAEPLYQLLCFCSDCQVVSGSQSYASHLIPLSQLKRLRGEPIGYAVQSDRGRRNTRMFCGECGSRVWAELEAGFASVNGMALDDKTAFKPTHNHRGHNAPAWCAIDTTLEDLPPS